MNKHMRMVALVVATSALLSSCAGGGVTGVQGPRPTASDAVGGVVPADEVSATAIALINATGSGGTVDLEVYELGNPAVIAALESAHRRGVAVRVILDATERQSKISAPELRAAGVATETMHVVAGIDHVKLLVADGKVLVGGVNYGTGSSYTTDMDVELGGGDVQYATTIFNTDWLAAGVDSAPANGSYGPFVTGGAIEPAILGVIDATGAGGACYVVANYLSDWTVRDALVAAARRGVVVDVVLNPTAYGEVAAKDALVAAGAHVKLAHPSPYLHAKVLACDSSGGWDAVVGSANFSYDGMTVNHELDVVISGNPGGRVGQWAERVW